MNKETASVCGRIALLLAIAAGALTIGPVHVQLDAQDQRAVREGALPREMVREIAAVYNAPGTHRIRGQFILAPSDTIRGDVAVLEGSATIEGVLLGQLVVINGDADLASSSEVRGNLTVVGGRLTRTGRVTGDIRVWRARLAYREVNGELVPTPDNEIAARWQRWRYTGDSERNRAEIYLSTAHSYNRVEGFPLYIGPRIRWTLGETRFDFEGFGIARLGNGTEFGDEDRGHSVRLEMRPARERGLSLGGRLFDEVEAVEKWQITDGEAGLTSFLFKRDYRDYWNRHGGVLYSRLSDGHTASASVSYSHERWTSRSTRNPWTLFGKDVTWRLNPLADEGAVHLVTLRAGADTRNDVNHPRTGWLAVAEYERGTGNLARRSPYNTPTFSTVDTLSPRIPVYTTWGRFFLDVRRYNRLGPGAQLNLRLVAGGWLHGDPLPQQRRLSVSGVDALPGYDFRRLMGDSYDSGVCVAVERAEYAVAGKPANCQRIALLQGEWKGDFHVHLFGDTDYGDSRWYTSAFTADGTWVLFVNSGRGWAPRIQGSESEFDTGGPVPAFSSWRTDVGGGFDLGSFGIYIAKAVTYGGESANIFIRLGRRF